MSSCSRIQRIAVTVVLMSLCIFARSVAVAQDLCLQGVGGLGGVPTLDGIVTGDAGWNNAVQVNLSGDLGATAGSQMLLGRASVNGQDSMLVGLVVDAPQAIGPDTTFVLVLSPDTSGGNDYRLIIRPFALAGAQVDFWQNSGTWNNAAPTAANPADWELKNLKATQSGGHWELELFVPITSPPNGVCIGCGEGASSFQLYANVLNTVLNNPPAPAGNVTGQDVWPPCPANVTCASVLPSGPITQHTPARTAWGTVWLTPQSSCRGVSLDALHVGVQDPSNASNIIQDIRRLADVNVPETTIAQCVGLPDTDAVGFGPANTFVAQPNNTMSNAAQVSILFRLANWGVPGAGLFSPLGTPVPAGCDPTSGAHTQCAGVNNNPTAQGPISALSSGNFNTTTWALNHKQSCFYKVNVHECIQVEMNSTDPNTRFLNRSVQRNMNFKPASTLKEAATISGDQGPLPAGQTRHRFLLQIDEDRLGPDTGATPQPQQPTGATRVAATEGKGVRYFRNPNLTTAARQNFGEAVDNMLSWIVRSYVLTGSKMIINGHEYEYMRRTGDFGYVAGHSGAISGWNWEFHGEGLERGKTGDLYSLAVAPGTAATVETTIIAQEPGLTYWMWICIALIVVVLLLFLIWLVRRESHA